MSDNSSLFSNWRQKAFSAVVLLLVVALGARIAAELLEPLLPALVALAILGAIGWVLFDRKR